MMTKSLVGFTPAVFPNSIALVPSCPEALNLESSFQSQETTVTRESYFSRPSVFSSSIFSKLSGERDDVQDDVVHGWINPTIIPSDEDEPVVSKQPKRKEEPSVDISDIGWIIERRKKEQEERDRQSWDNGLRIPLEDPQERERWIEEQKRRDKIEQPEDGERGEAIVDYKF